jgi:hypothetical protein
LQKRISRLKIIACVHVLMLLLPRLLMQKMKQLLLILAITGVLSRAFQLEEDETEEYDDCFDCVCPVPLKNVMKPILQKTSWLYRETTQSLIELQLSMNDVLLQTMKSVEETMGRIMEEWAWQRSDDECGCRCYSCGACISKHHGCGFYAIRGCHVHCFDIDKCMAGNLWRGTDRTPLKTIWPEGVPSGPRPFGDVPDIRFILTKDEKFKAVDGNHTLCNKR